MIKICISVTSHALDPPSPCHKLSHLLGPLPSSIVMYFMDGPLLYHIESAKAGLFVLEPGQNSGRSIHRVKCQVSSNLINFIFRSVQCRLVSVRMTCCVLWFVICSHNGLRSSSDQTHLNNQTADP